MENGRLMPVVHYVDYKVGAENLRNAEATVPAPGPGELLIKVEATSLNPVDWKIQGGRYKPFIPARFPYVPCSDISGIVTSVGSEVVGFSVGDRVVSYLDHKEGGGLGGYATAEAQLTAKLPAEISFVEAAGLPVAGLTALKSLQDSAGISALDGSYKGNILVTAASGGVGTYAVQASHLEVHEKLPLSLLVQIAKLAGAHVVATCGSRNMKLVKSLGADEVLDYRSPAGAKLQSSTCSKFDVIIHCAAGGVCSSLEKVLSSRGVLVDITPKPVNIMKSVIRKLTMSKTTLVPFYLHPHGKDIQLLVHMLQQGKLRTVIDSVYHVSDVRDAWQKCMDGHATGKIVVIR